MPHESQKVCICGREKSKEKPLVVTITACKNKHPHHLLRDKTPSNYHEIHPDQRPKSPRRDESGSRSPPKATSTPRLERSEHEPKKSFIDSSEFAKHESKTSRHSTPSLKSVEKDSDKSALKSRDYDTAQPIPEEEHEGDALDRDEEEAVVENSKDEEETVVENSKESTSEENVEKTGGDEDEDTPAVEQEAADDGDKEAAVGELEETAPENDIPTTVSEDLNDALERGE